MITHLNEKLIAVEVPSDAIEIEASYIKIADMTELSFEDSSSYCWKEDAPLIDGNWKILGEVDADNISFDVEPYVNSFYNEKMHCFSGYENYLKGINFYSKNDSFRSLLKSKGIDTNKPNVKHVILEKC